MIELLRELVEIESPTGDTAEIRGRMAAELRALGGDVSLDGEHVRADFGGAGPPLLLLGHFDTVWPRGTLATMPWRVEAWWRDALAEVLPELLPDDGVEEAATLILRGNARALYRLSD
jgi:acetylornithine deacetylase/succinyl-diaminopimelate desuccinylase-like protein